MQSEDLAKRIRLHAIDMVNHARASHIGSILSETDIVAVLYTDIMNYDPNNPSFEERDRFVLSKGHAGVAIYCALAEMGFFSIDELKKYGDDGSLFSCHVSHKGIPGVEVSTGSLGHGCSIACGMALHAKKRKKRYRVYTLLGDGECNEGTVWEMALLASQNKLENLTVIIDRNEMQAMGYCKDIINTEPFASKWESFGWNVIEVDGHNHDDLRQALKTHVTDKPTVIIAHTIKGKGVSFMENELLWHYRDPQGEYYDRAKEELGRL